MTDGDSQVRRRFNREPLVAIVIAFAAGIVIAKLAAVSIGAGVGALSVFAVAAFLTRKHSIATGFILLGFAAAGAISLGSEGHRNASPDRLRNIYDSGQIESGTPVEIEGILSGQPEAAFDGEFLTVQAGRLWRQGA